MICLRCLGGRRRQMSHAVRTTPTGPRRLLRRGTRVSSHSRYSPRPLSLSLPLPLSWPWSFSLSGCGDSSGGDGVVAGPRGRGPGLGLAPFFGPAGPPAFSLALGARWFWGGGVVGGAGGGRGRTAGAAAVGAGGGCVWAPALG